MADFAAIDQMLSSMQQALEKVVGEEITGMQFDAEKIQVGSEISAGWQKASVDLEKAADKARQDIMGLPAEIGKQVDKVFGDALPPGATEIIKGLVLPKVQAATQKVLSEVNGLSVKDVLYGKGLEKLSEAQGRLSAALVETTNTGGMSKFQDMQQQLKQLITTKPEAMFGALGGLKQQLSDSVMEINASSATVMAGFSKAIEVFDSLGVTGKLNLNISDVEATVNDVQSKLSELEKVAILTQVDLKTKGGISPANSAKYDQLIDDILTRVDAPSSLNIMRRVKQLKNVPKLAQPLQEATQKFDTAVSDIEGFIGEIAKLDTDVAGNSILKHNASQFSKFRDSISKLKTQVAGVGKIVPNLTSPTAMSDRAKQLLPMGGAINTAAGTTTPTTVDSPFVQQKNIFKSLEPAASGTFTKVKAEMQAGKFIKTNLAVKNPADIIKPSSPNFNVEGNQAHTEMTNLINTSPMRQELGNLQTSLKNYEQKIGRFEGGGLVGSLVKSEMQGVMSDAQSIVASSSEFLEDLETIAEPISKEFQDIKREAKQLGDETVNSLLDKGKLDALLKSSWDILKSSNNANKAMKDITKLAKQTYSGDITKIEATVKTMEQRIDRTRLAGKKIETEFNARVKRINSVVEQRTTRLKQVKTAYDTMKALTDVLKSNK